MKYAALVALATFLSSVKAVAVWGQCGGIGYTGSTTCDAGSTCIVVNDYYFQCQPGSAVTTTAKPTSTTGGGGTTTTGPAPTDTSNPYTGYEVWPIPYYAAEVAAAAAQTTDATLKAKIQKVATIPTFHWLDTISKVPTLTDYLSQISALQKSSGKKYILQIVVYDLPDRDCHANASNGELHIDSNGAALYKSSYIDPIAAAISKYPDVRVVAVVEPDSLANLVTNQSDPRCSKADPVYRSSVVYAIQTLKQANVFLYLDAGHAGWLGWPANITPAAQLFGSLLKTAGGTFRVRGLATNVANYNALTAASPDPITQGNSNYDETHYINALAPLLTQNGYPAHFIVDQGRSGKQNIRNEWGDWCNVKGAGFGTRPTTSTGNSLIDAIVWVKPGGESDGTSDTTATRYDSFCGKADAFQPSPEAGSWNQAYFVALVQNANPAL